MICEKDVECLAGTLRMGPGSDGYEKGEKAKKVDQLAHDYTYGGWL